MDNGIHTPRLPKILTATPGDSVLSGVGSGAKVGGGRLLGGGAAMVEALLDVRLALALACKPSVLPGMNEH